MKINLYSIFESMDAWKKVKALHDKTSVPVNILADNMNESRILFDLSNKYNNNKLIDLDNINDMLYKKMDKNEFMQKQGEFIGVIFSFLLHQGIIDKSWSTYSVDNILNTYNNRGNSLKDNGILFEFNEGYKGILASGSFHIFFPDQLNNMGSPMNCLRIEFAINQPTDRSLTYENNIDFGFHMPDNKFKPSDFIKILQFIADMINLINSAQFTSIFTLIKKLFRKHLYFSTIIKNINKQIIWEFNDYQDIFHLLIIFFFIEAFQEKKDYFVLNCDSLVSYICDTSQNPYKLKYFDMLDKDQKEDFISDIIQSVDLSVLKKELIESSFSLSDFFNNLLYENGLLPYNPHKKGLIRKVSVMKTLNKFVGPTEIINF